MMNSINLIILSFLSLILVSCSEEVELNIQNESSESKHNIEIPKDELYRIAREVPSPVELASLIKDHNMIFNASLLNDKNNFEHYNNKYNQAINLGIYSADLGYVNVYGKYALAIEYMVAVRNLSEDLKVGQFFDYKTLQRLAENRQEIDSILYISVESYDAMSSYLKDQGRDDINALLVIGGWIEAMHIITNIQRSHQVPILEERIGEQKVIMNDIYKLISAMENQHYFQLLKEDMLVLKNIYEEVVIVETEPKRIINDLGTVLEVIDQNESKIEIDQSQIDNIFYSVEKIRKKLVE